MSEQTHLIQESISLLEHRDDPEYLRMLAAYCDNPFFDLTKDRIAEYTKSKTVASTPSL